MVGTNGGICAGQRGDRIFLGGGLRRVGFHETSTACLLWRLEEVRVVFCGVVVVVSMFLALQYCSRFGCGVVGFCGLQLLVEDDTLRSPQSSCALKMILMQMERSSYGFSLASSLRKIPLNRIL